MIKPKFLKPLLFAWLTILFSGIAYLFWHNEYVYSLPTPIPVSYKPLSIGEKVNLEDNLIPLQARPVLLHFFNPACPCSRFNIPHIQTLVEKYKTKINFVVVVLSKDSSYTENDIQDKFDLTVPVSFDQSLAQKCGVYSTPQAVILDANQQLYYRGNYNKSRYCTDKLSNFAQMAIDSLLSSIDTPLFSELATDPYGCQLPTCTK